MITYVSQSAYSKTSRTFSVMGLIESLFSLNDEIDETSAILVSSEAEIHSFQVGQAASVHDASL